MADISITARNKNAHDVRNLSYGSFGALLYDDSKEEWSASRRDTEKNPDGESDEGLPLTLLHAASILETNNSEGNLSIATRRLQATRAGGLADFHDLVSIKNFLNDDDSANTSTNQIRVKPVFCYALSPYEQGLHRALLPVVATVSAEGDSISVRPIRMTCVEELGRSIPLLDERACIIRPPSSEPVLELSCSPDKIVLAIRQGSATSFCSILLSASQGEVPGSTLFTFENVLTLPISRTGGWPHASVAFHPTISAILGVVDQHGNWSIWKRIGRAKVTTRILSSLHLQVSGKLLPNPHGPVSRSGPYFDGWHSISFLEDTNSVAVLVCSRRVAKLFNLEADFLADVDMRLGTHAAGNQVLEVQTSLADRSICYVLTTTRIMVMRMADHENDKNGLKVVGSWTHFCDARKKNLSMCVLDGGAFTLLVLAHDCGHLKLFCIRRSTAQSIASFDDPRDLVLPELDPKMILPSTIAMQLVALPPEKRRNQDVEQERLVKLNVLSKDGLTTDLTFSLSFKSHFSASEQSDQLCLKIATQQEWKIRSSRTVDEDDDLPDVVVPDHAVMQGAVIRNRTHDSLSLTVLPPTRNWPDLLIHNADVCEGTAAASLNVLEGEAVNMAADQQTLHSIIDLVKDFRVADIEELATDVGNWEVRVVDRKHQDGAKLFRDVVGPSGITVDQSHRSLLDKFVEPMSRDLPDRARVQTERLARQVAFDVYASGVILSKPATNSANETLPNPADGASLTTTHDQKTPFDALRQYTTFTELEPEKRSNSTMSRILAHLPIDLYDPATYSYIEVEDRLREEQSQQAFSQLSDSEKRRVERANLRKEKKLAQQARLRDAAQTQTSFVPGINTLSQHVDPREVQSSQAFPDLPPSSQPLGLPMTQPERGAHGERKKVKKHAGRRKGF